MLSSSFLLTPLKSGQTICRLRLNDAVTDPFTITISDGRVEHLYEQNIYLEVIYPKDAVPDGYHVQIDNVTPDEADKAAILSAYPNAKICHFYELSMVHENRSKITDFNKPVTIRLQIPAYVDNPKKLTFVYFGEKGPETLKTTICTDGYVEYQIGHFSKYFLIETENENPTTTVQTENPVYPLGDVNVDKAINASDALLNLRHAVKEITLEGDAFTRGDVTFDQSINASDALQILRYAVKEISDFK